MSSEEPNNEEIDKTKVSDELNDLMTDDASKPEPKSVEKKKKKGSKKEEPKNSESEGKAPPEAETPAEKPKESAKKKIVLVKSEFKIKFKDSKTIRNLYEAVSGILKEFKMKADPEEGVIGTAMDDSHICFVNLIISKKDMDEFDIKEATEIGLSMDDFVKMLKRCEASEYLELQAKASEKHLTLLFVPEKGTKARKFKLNFIDLGMEDVQVDSLHALEYPNSFTVDPTLLNQAISDAEICSEVLGFSIKENKLHLSSLGSTGEMDNEYGKDEFKESNLVKDMIEGNYAIQFLKPMLKIASFVNDIQVELGGGMPLHVKAKFFENSSVEYYLAPRVETDEMDVLD